MPGLCLAAAVNLGGEKCRLEPGVALIICEKGYNMTTIVEEGRPRDHYEATLEDGSLVMKPYCACGNLLGEDYFCEKCKRRCHCNLIVCNDEATFDLVKIYIRRSPSFSAFNAKLKGDIRVNK